MEPTAAILDDKQLVRLLAHLGLPADFPTLAAGREPFRKAREKAKERLASAAAAFDAMEEPALTEQDSILRYLAAHGKMRESAGALSEVVVSLGLPGLPGGGQGGADGDGADLERCDPLSFSKPARGR